jgi:hypothetical protein
MGLSLNLNLTACKGRPCGHRTIFKRPDDWAAPSKIQLGDACVRFMAGGITQMPIGRAIIVVCP